MWSYPYLRFISIRRRNAYNLLPHTAIIQHIVSIHKHHAIYMTYIIPYL